MKASGFVITPRQYAMLLAVKKHGDPGWVYASGEDGKYERTKRSLISRGFIEKPTDARPAPFVLTHDGVRALEDYRAREADRHDGTNRFTKETS